MLARAAGSAVRRLAARAEPVGGPLVSNLAGWEANSSASASCRGWRSLSSWTGTTSASTTSAWYPAASDEASRWQRRSASTTRQFTSGASASVAAGTPQEVDLAEDDEGAGRLPEDEATGARVDAASEARSPSPTAPTSPRPVASEMARPLEYMVPVRAYYVGNFIDFHALAKRLPSYPKEFFRESVIVRMTPRRASEDDGAGVGARTETGEGHTLRADADASAAFGDVPAPAKRSPGGTSLFRGVQVRQRRVLQHGSTGEGGVFEAREGAREDAFGGAVHGRLSGDGATKAGRVGAVRGGPRGAQAVGLEQHQRHRDGAGADGGAGAPRT